MKLRIIIGSNLSGSREEVIFSDEYDHFNDPASDYLSPDLIVGTDEVVDIELPMGFPINYVLIRKA
jgi:hypothetical protein